MEPQIVFYRLSRKVVNNQDEIPEEARQVLYYSLLIGHHVGVMDCFSEMMAVPGEEYRTFLEQLPQGETRTKLEGVLRWKEIEINRGHADAMLEAVQQTAGRMHEAVPEWLNTLGRCLQEIKAEPALYMMVKVRA